MIPAETIEKVLNEIDPDELIKLTAELVRINSVWDPAAGTSEKPVAELVVQWAQTQGFAVQQDEVAPGRPNAVITWSADPGERELMFEGHTDVVTPGDVSAWNYDPFGAQIVGRQMYGRGTNDTKGNLAAMLIAMKALKRSGVTLAGTIVGGVLCDEEDQMLGVRDFIARGHADKITAAVICEPQDGLICISQKGALRARYTVYGRMSHGAMPLAGLNCAPALARLIDGLHKLEREAITNIGRDEHLGWPSFTPTVIQSPMTGTPHGITRNMTVNSY
jgi:succinyl-diaminopimelate desuccinylase